MVKLVERRERGGEYNNTASSEIEAPSAGSYYVPDAPRVELTGIIMGIPVAAAAAGRRSTYGDGANDVVCAGLDLSGRVDSAV